MIKKPESFFDKLQEEFDYYKRALDLLEEVYLHVEIGEKMPQDLRWKIDEFFGKDEDE